MTSYSPAKSRYDQYAKNIFALLGNMPTAVFFALIFVYYLLVTIQGLDFNDEGFHAAVYQQIFTDPISVQYGFWMWLTGILGGGFLKLFPFLGLWGLRFEGVIISMATIAVSYHLLKKYLHKGYLRLSIIMLVLFINEDAKNFYYNNFSAFCYILAVFFIFTGLRDNKRISILLGGLIVCLNIFNRTPNLLGIGMVIAIPYYGYLFKIRLKIQLQNIGIFLCGFLLGLILVYVSMKLLGHLEIFLNSMKMVFGLSQEAKSSDGLEGTYQISKMLLSNVLEYLRAARSFILVILLILVSGFISQSGSGKSHLLRNICRLINYLIVVVILMAIYMGLGNHYRLILLFTGFSLVSALLLFDQKTDPLLRLLVLLGGFILLVHPFGSSEGIATVIVYSLWISFPISIDLLSKVQKVDIHLLVTKLNSKFSSGIIISENRLRVLRIFTFSLIIVACAFNVLKYPYLCDRHARRDMRYSVNNHLMKGILTTKARVGAIDELLEASSNFAKPGDTVLAFDCIPMYHFMTETKSYVRNPCIWFYTTNLFKSELDYSEANYKKLPVVVRQKIKTTGDGSSWPEIPTAEDYALLKRNLKKNAYFNEFLFRNHYKIAWSSAYFEILTPPIK